MAGICVSIGTDDGVRVKLGHYGDSKYYYHYVLGDGGVELAGVVENPYAGERDEGPGGRHGEAAKRGQIYELNRDCSVIVATSFGPGGAEYMRGRGLEVVLVKPRTMIEEALRIVADRVLSSGSGKA